MKDVEVKGDFRTVIKDGEIYLHASDVIYYFQELEEVLQSERILNSESLNKMHSTLKESCIRILNKNGGY